jgi:hypothetical protein
MSEEEGVEFAGVGKKGRATKGDRGGEKRRLADQTKSTRE